MTPDERIDASWRQLLPECEPSTELRQLWRNTITAAVEAERKSCAKILQDTYEAWVDGDYSPGEAFESAKEKILYGDRSNASSRSVEPAEK